jgi:hypothetical protein
VSSFSFLCGAAAPLCAGLVNAVLTGITSGDLGLALKAGFITAVTAAAFFAVGELTTGFGVEGGVLNPSLGGHGPLGFGSPAHLFNIAGHALVGCGSAVASGGKCGPGALSGAAGSFAGPLLTGLNFEGKLVATSIVGGLASVAGGGKFANGAVTAAFGYIFNEVGANRAAHQAAVDAEADRLRALGFWVTPNVSFWVGDTLYVADLVVSRGWFPPIPFEIIEIKTGDGTFTPNQEIAIPILERGAWTTPVELRALQAGFIPGIPFYVPPGMTSMSRR